MKTFILALVLLGLIVGVLFLTGCYLIRQADALMAAAQAFPTARDSFPSADDSFPTAANAFEAQWKESRRTLRFLLGPDDTDRIEEEFLSLRIAYTVKDVSAYLTAREKLLRTVDQIKDAGNLLKQE